MDNFLIKFPQIPIGHNLIEKGDPRYNTGTGK